MRNSYATRRQRILLALAALASVTAASSNGEGPPAAEQSETPTKPLPASEPATLAIPDLPILVQAFVEPIGSIHDGSIIELVGPAWKAILEAVEKDPEVLFRLSPRQLEELIAASYDAAGFDEVVLTPRSGDFGRDVIATKHDRFRIRIIDQVKAYSAGHRVSADDVRALSGVLHADPRATKGVLTTTSTFAPGIKSDPYIAPLIPYRLELFDGAELTERLLRLRPHAG